MLHFNESIKFPEEIRASLPQNYLNVMFSLNCSLNLCSAKLCNTEFLNGVLVVLMPYIPENNFSALSGQFPVFLGQTSTN